MARPHNLRKTAAVVPQETQEQLQVADRLMSLPAIEGPKSWSDDVERAAIWSCLHSAPPHMALAAAGVSPRLAQEWLSDDPPPGYERACRALSSRLKEAELACAAQLFGCINKAAQDPRYWTAAAWTLERKHGYVAQNTALSGPSVVVNVGQMIVNTDGKRSLPRFEPIIEAEAIPAESLDHISSVKE